MRNSRCLPGCSLVVLTFGLFTVSPVVAAATASVPTPQKPTVANVEVVQAVHWIRPGETVPVPQAGLGDWIRLQVKNLDALLQKTTVQKPLSLYINGLELPGLEPVFGGGDPKGEAYVRFHLERTDASAAHWSELLGKPGAMIRNVQVSVGVAGCGAGCTDMAVPKSFDLIVIRLGGIALFLLLVLLVAGLLWKYGKSDMLRDSVPSPPALPVTGEVEAQVPIPPTNRPFSLGRCQMAFWFFLVVTAFFFIWLVTGNLSSLTPSVLILIGISAATGLGAVAIDANKRGADVAQRDQLVDDQARLQAATATLAAAAQAPAPPAPNVAPAGALALPVPPIQAHLAATQADLAALTAKAALWRPLRSQRHVRFLTDVLSDENGVSFHRLQIFVWTIVLGIVFVAKVAVTLTMPDFDNQLLALMGISGGTYLGFKLPEKQV